MTDAPLTDAELAELEVAAEAVERIARIHANNVDRTFPDYKETDYDRWVDKQLILTKAARELLAQRSAKQDVPDYAALSARYEEYRAKYVGGTIYHINNAEAQRAAMEYALAGCALTPPVPPTTQAAPSSQDRLDALAEFNGAILTIVGYDHDSLIDGRISAKSTETIRAALSQPTKPDAVPDGWQLVPTKPTWEMNKAGFEAHQDARERREPFPENFCYRAMLAAAPKAGSHE